MKIINTAIFILFLSFFTQCNNIEEKKDELICPELIKLGAQHIGGEDGGSVFLITRESCLMNDEYRIRGFLEDCSAHWDGIFILDSNSTLDLSSPYEFVPLSHYEFCTIKQNGKQYKLKFKEKYKNCE